MPLLNRWNDELASRCANALALRAYSSRLLGADPSLVLHGGGNTSVKIEDTLWVKGSGSDLAQVTERDFTPLELASTRALLAHEHLTNEAMGAALVPLVRGTGYPKPSIETLLHASLPAPFVEHTHADAILAVTNTDNGEDIAARLFGTRAPCVPFRQSGFELAKASMASFNDNATAETIGLILLQHGVFAIGADARGAYGNMLALVNSAERYLASRGAWELPRAEGPAPWSAEHIATLRRETCLAAGFPLLASVQDDPETLAFARREDLAIILEQGPATPQHAVFIKRRPLTGPDVKGYTRDYLAYVGNAQGAPDPAPRVILDANFGALVLGYGPDYLRMAEDIFRHGREIMTRASAHDRYRGLPAAAILEAEIHYGGFERRLRQANAPRDTLRGQCVGIGVRDSGFAAALEAGLSQRGAACLQARDADSPATVARRYGGMDAIIFDSSHFGWVDSLRPLLRLAPFGARALCVDATPATTSELRAIATSRDLPTIINSLTP